jgi:hypothetical protein
LKLVGFKDNITCVFSDTNPRELMVTKGFSSDGLTGTSISFKIEGIKNPVTDKETGSF